MAKELLLSPTSVKNILNQNHIQFFQPIEVYPLSLTHTENRVNFCNNMLNVLQQSIIFTDKSSIDVDLKGHGIWRKMDLYHPGSFYEKTAQHIHIMAWGKIGPRGFRTPWSDLTNKSIQKNILKLSFNIDLLEISEA